MENDFVLPARLLKFEEREYKKKDNSLGIARDINLLIDSGDVVKLGYNNFHDSFNFREAKDLVGKRVDFSFRIISNRFNYDNPLIVFTGVSAGTGSKQ